jgi:trehalose utilization protein
MKHQNYTENFEVDGPYQDCKISWFDCVFIFLAGVTVGVITAIFAMGY